MSFIKELVICLLIILAIIEFDMLVSNYYESQKNEIYKIIDDLEKELEKENFNQDISEKLYEKWFSLEKKSGYFVEHDELEKVSLKITVIRKCTKIEEKEDAINLLEEVKFLIEHIFEKDKLKLRNIF